MTLSHDHAALKSLSLDYARAVDRRDSDLLLTLLSDDAQVIMPGVTMQGEEAFASITATLASMFESTQHKVHNQTITINGNIASGETYCTASHLRRRDDGKLEVEDWAIRYQDEYIKLNERWFFKVRELVIDWVEIRPAMAFGEQFEQ